MDELFDDLWYVELDKMRKRLSKESGENLKRQITTANGQAPHIQGYKRPRQDRSTVVSPLLLINA